MTQTSGNIHHGTSVLITPPGASTNNAFPGICTLSQPEHLLVAYRSAAGHSSTLKGVIRGKKSFDAGRTWGDEFVIYDDATQDARDPTLLRLSTGRILCAFFPHNPTYAAIIYSDDDGNTWSPLIGVNENAPNTNEAVCGPPIEMPNGDVLLVTYGNYDGVATTDWYWSRLYRSTDQGETWTFVTVIADGNDSEYLFSFQEPNLLLLANGDVLCAHRTSIGRIRLFRSTNSGTTWAPVTHNELVASGRPHMFQLDNGSITMLPRKGGLAKTTSWDNGETWTMPWGNVASAPDVGGTSVYADSAHVADNMVAVVYALEWNDRAYADVYVTYMFPEELAGTDPLAVASGRFVRRGGELVPADVSVVRDGSLFPAT